MISRRSLKHGFAGAGFVPGATRWGSTPAIGSGLSDIEAGLRLRYEIRRELAPYVGVHWVRRFGETADFASDDSETRFVAGVRVWF